MFIINALNSAAGLQQLLLENLFYILHAYLCKHLSVDNNKGSLVAPVHATGSPQHHLVIEMILFQVISQNLHNFPVTS